MSSFTFDPSDIDFQASRDRLEQALRSSELWTGVLDNQVGTALLDFLATINVFAQNRILASVRECFPETCASDRGAFALACFQGIRLNRNSPATCQVTLTSPTAVSIPPYSKFVAGDGLFLFNREHLFLSPNTPQTVVMAEGVVNTLVTEGLGNDFQSLIPVERDFVVSDQDVSVEVDGVALERATDGLWNYRGVDAFQDQTLPDGRLAIRFGTLVFGARPSSGTTVVASYVITSGAQANALGGAGEAARCANFPSVTAVMNTSLSGGVNSRPALQYKNVEAPNFGSFGSAVKRSQHVSTALQFPGVIDVRTFSQREIDPTDLEWMNLIKLVPLTSSVWDYATRQRFISFMEESTMYASRFYIENPVATLVDVEVRGYCDKFSSPTSVENAIREAITEMFVLRRGSLEKDVYISQLSSVIKSASRSLTRFDILSPTRNVVCSTEPVREPNLTAHAGGGTIPAGNYIYGLAADVLLGDGSIGYLRLKNRSMITTGSNGSIQVSWDTLPNAITYYVYGRSTASGGFGLLSSQAHNPAVATQSWNDTGAVSPGADAPPKSNVPVQYPILNSLVVNVLVER